MKLKVDLSLEDKINIELFKLEEELVEIEVLEDLVGFGPFFGISFSGAKAKTKIKLPRFYANYLVFTEKAKFIENEIYISLLNSLKQQKPSFKLNNIPNDLLLSSLVSIGKISTSHELMTLVKNSNDFDLINKTFINLITERFKRILKHLAINDYKSIERDLDTLEKPLIKIFSTLIHEYFDITNLTKK